MEGICGDNGSADDEKKKKLNLYLINLKILISILNYLLIASFALYRAIPDPPPLSKFN